ncbi:MAG: heme ABC transporter ATP-binding protein [Chloroflexota bacterium]|nr:MAG: heme ABC transporter ATP-binding protein [Chloroflexota bacterium]
MTATTFLRMENITKTFPGVVANNRVNLDVRHGEIHALLGENGAGKSTLMNVLYGLYQPDSGQIYLNDQPTTIHSPDDAIAKGIGMVHQHFMLVPPLSVTENVMLGLPGEKGILLNHQAAKKNILDISLAYGLEVNPDLAIWNLSVGTQQRVEIIKALYRGAKLLILDEPSAVLTPQEIEGLFGVMRRLVGNGNSIIFITHKLDEVMEISDRVTVLRDGLAIQTVETRATTKAELARLMVGREVLFRLAKPAVEPGEVKLEVTNLVVNDDRHVPAVRNLSLHARAGEIVGLAGVDGNGQRELAEAIAGLRPPQSGTIRISGRETTALNSGDLLHFNLAYIPEDRHREGLILGFKLSENFIARNFRRRPFSVRGLLQYNAIKANARQLIQRFDVRTPSAEVTARTLSGGNQQKVVLARELSENPDLIIAAHPTRGLDVGATEFVENRLLEQRARGAAILYISTELEEILNLSDRIAVIHRGEIMGVVRPTEVTPETLGLMMAGTQHGPVENISA